MHISPASEMHISQRGQHLGSGTGGIWQCESFVSPGIYNFTGANCSTDIAFDDVCTCVRVST